MARDGGEQCGLADARLAAEQHQRARHDAPAQHAIQLPRAGGEAPVPGRFVLRERRRRGAARPRETRDAAIRLAAGAGDHCLDEAIPLATVGAAAHPLRALVAALLANELRMWSCHRYLKGLLSARVGEVCGL